jgi:hypothetical protein
VKHEIEPDRLCRITKNSFNFSRENEAQAFFWPSPDIRQALSNFFQLIGISTLSFHKRS